MAGILGGITTSEIASGLKAVDELVQLVEKLPFISSSGAIQTALKDLDEGLQFAEKIAGEL